ncbi:unnamed protein product [Brachionus calyciflorus]|uniref:G-protein coupled receptors family 2 profile 1 domain-containing protein n=1 Tax=Brachionus calyciflorus TaxID=104777 RepID=A0A814K6R2_9BILA|nr:unnamed protein product [Brachionus calyciflorus]
MNVQRAFAFNIRWPRTNFNQVANSSCPKGSTGVSYRLCKINGWASNLVLSECKSTKIDSHLNKYSQDLNPKINSYQAFNIIEDLSRITLDAKLDYDEDNFRRESNSRY